MIILTKIISSFLIPPGIFILAFLLICLISKSKHVKYLSLFFAISIYILSTFFGTYLISYPLENAYKIPAITKDASCVVIILSGGIVYHNGEAELNRATFKRLYAGFKVALKTGGNIIVSGGNIFSNSVPSSHIMKKRLMEFGIDKNRIIVQDKSRNTYEDALYSKKILNNYNEDKIYLVTSAFHMKRSVKIFSKMFKGVKIIPVPSDFIVNERINIIQFFPDNGVFFANSLAIHELLGNLWYDLGGYK